MSSLLRPKTLLIDASVWVAFFLGAQPQADAILKLFQTCEMQQITLCYAPTTLKDVFYLIPRQMRREAIAEGLDVEGVSFEPAAWACVEKMTEIAVAATQSLVECHLALMLRSRHRGFGGNLLFAAGETSKADRIVTYDRQLAAHFPGACVTPEEALILLSD